MNAIGMLLFIVVLLPMAWFVAFGVVLFSAVTGAPDTYHARDGFKEILAKLGEQLDELLLG